MICPDKPQAHGRVASVRGSVVDCQFDNSVPAIHTILLASDFITNEDLESVLRESKKPSVTSSAMGDTLINLRRRIKNTGDLRTVIRTMKAISAGHHLPDS